MHLDVEKGPHWLQHNVNVRLHYHAALLFGAWVAQSWSFQGGIGVVVAGWVWGADRAWMHVPTPLSSPGCRRLKPACLVGISVNPQLKQDLMLSAHEGSQDTPG